MPPWLLPLFLILVWGLWVMGCASQRAVEDARRGVPEEQRGGVSIFPGIPVFPLAFWGIAWIIDRAASPWGTVVTGAAHAVFAIWLLISIARDWRHLRSIDGPA